MPSVHRPFIPLTSMVEREQKLAVEDDFRLPPMPGRPLPRRTFTSTYFDTLDHCLARTGVTLRRRNEKGTAVWQLKLPLNGARREIECGEPSMTPPPEFVDALIVLLEGKHLVPVAEIRTSRAAMRLREGKSEMEVALDAVSVLRNGIVIQRFKELEIESLNENERGIEKLLSILYRAGARPHDGRPKLFRALSLAYGSTEEPDPHAPLAEQIRHGLSRQLQTLKQCDPGIRLCGGAEDVHRIRVAIRRMRTLLLAVRKIVSPDWVEPLLSGLKWLGGVFSLARDLDVEMEYFKSEAEQLKPRDRRPLEQFLRHLASDREQAQRTLLDEMKSARYVGFVRKLQDAADAPAVVKPAYTLRDAAARQFKKLRKTVRTLKRCPSDAELHRVRIQTKRARYAAELAQHDSKRIGRFIKAAAEFQNLLGRHHDAVVAARHVQAFIKYHGNRQAAFTAGILVERAKQRREAVRSEFWSAWKRLKKRGTRAWN